VARPMPGGADAEEFADGGDFPRGADAADLGQMAADEIDQPPGDEFEPFVWIIEELAHGDGSGALLAENFEITDILRSKRIFEKEQTVRLQFLGQADGVNGREALVQVVEQLDFFPEMLAQVFEKFRNGAPVSGRLEEFAGKMAFASEAGRSVS